MSTWRERVLEAARAQYEADLKRPCRPGMFRPWMLTPGVECNLAALEVLREAEQKSAELGLIGKWGRPGYGIWRVLRSREPRRSPDSCMQLTCFDEQHVCFLPAGRARWTMVTWWYPLLPGLLPLRDFQPYPYRDQARKQFCCPDAAYLYARGLEAKGMLDVQLVRGSGVVTLEEYGEMIFGQEPCWKDKGRVTNDEQ